MDVYLIRHTQVAVAPGTCYGRSDVALADSFRDEWKRLREKLPVAEAQMVYSSPLSRCRLFAESLAPCHLTIDARLTELDFGRWELQAWDDIDRLEFDAWSANIVSQNCPEGESYQEQFQRALDFWNDCTAEREKDLTLFVVTHSGLIRALLASILEIPLENSLRLGLDFGSVTKIHFLQDVPIVDYINR